MGGMQLLARLLVFFLLATILRADGALAQARRAQAMVGAETWSRVIRVDNASRFGRYPRVVYALVFELADLLWFYTDTDGTQSLSLHRGRLAEEKADLGSLLRKIEPGFTQWCVVPDQTGLPVASRGALPNGCFIDSVAALRERLARGGAVMRPQLLSFYVETSMGLKGHTVLTYETSRGAVVIDPTGPTPTQTFPVQLARDPLALARAFGGPLVDRARVLPLEVPQIYLASSASGSGHEHG